MKTLEVSIAPNLSFCFEGFPESFQVRLRAFFRYFVERPTTAETAPPLVIRSLAQRARPPGRLVADREGLIASVVNDTILFELPHAWSLGTSADGAALLCLESVDEATLDAVVTQMVVPLLFDLALARGWLGLHAAALTCGEVGVLFPGASGSGKSTLFRSAEAHGWGWLSDDLVWMRAEAPGALTVLPFPRGAPISPQSMPTAARMIPRAVVFPSIGDPSAESATVIQRVSEVEAFRRICLQVSLFNLGLNRKTAIDSVAALANLDAFDLRVRFGKQDGALQLLRAELLAPHWPGSAHSC